MILGRYYMAVTYVGRKSTPCIRLSMGDVKACHARGTPYVFRCHVYVTRGIFVNLRQVLNDASAARLTAAVNKKSDRSLEL